MSSLRPAKETSCLKLLWSGASVATLKSQCKVFPILPELEWYEFNRTHFLYTGDEQNLKVMCPYQAPVEYRVGSSHSTTLVQIPCFCKGYLGNFEQFVHQYSCGNDQRDHIEVTNYVSYHYLRVNELIIDRRSLESTFDILLTNSTLNRTLLDHDYTHNLALLRKDEVILRNSVPTIDWTSRYTSTFKYIGWILRIIAVVGLGWYFWKKSRSATPAAVVLSGLLPRGQAVDFLAIVDDTLVLSLLLIIIVLSLVIIKLLRSLLNKYRCHHTRKTNCFQFGNHIDLIIRYPDHSVKVGLLST